MPLSHPPTLASSPAVGPFVAVDEPAWTRRQHPRPARVLCVLWVWARVTTGAQQTAHRPVVSLPVSLRF